MYMHLPLSYMFKPRSFPILGLMIAQYTAAALGKFNMDQDSCSGCNIVYLGLHQMCMAWPHHFLINAVSENKVLTHPSTVDSISTCGGAEDHVSMGEFAARKALQVVEHVEYGE